MKHRYNNEPVKHVNNNHNLVPVHNLVTSFCLRSMKNIKKNILRTNRLETNFSLTWTIYFRNKSWKNKLHKNAMLNYTELLPARIFPYSDWIQSKSLYSVRMRKNGDKKNSVSGYVLHSFWYCCATLQTLNCLTIYYLSLHFIYLLYRLSSCFLLPKNLFSRIYNLLTSFPTPLNKK